MENVEEVKKKSKGKESRYGKRYGLAFRLRCAKLGLGRRDPVKLPALKGGACGALAGQRRDGKPYRSINRT